MSSSADGRVLTAAWVSIQGSTAVREVWEATSTDGGGLWSTAKRISKPADQTNGQDLPIVAVSGNGATVAVFWKQIVSGIGNFWGVTSQNSGQTFTSSAALSENSNLYLWDSAPNITITPDGTNITATWADMGAREFPGENQIYARHSADSGLTWSKVVTISQPSSGDTSSARQQVQASTDGRLLIAVWPTQVGSKTGVYSSTSKDAGASWSVPVLVSGPDGDLGRVTRVGDLAADGKDDRIVVSWARDSGMVQTATSANSGASWANPVTVSKSGSPSAVDPGDRPAATASTDANAVTLSWQALDLATKKPCIWASRSIDSGGTWSAPTRLSSADEAVNDDQPPLMSSKQDGSNVTVLWADQVMLGSQKKNQLVAASSSNGEAWSAPTLVSAPASDKANVYTFPSFYPTSTIAMATATDRDSVTVVWQSEFFSQAPYIKTADLQSATLSK